jgi:hypothetical protein
MPISTMLDKSRGPFSPVPSPGFAAIRPDRRAPPSPGRRSRPPSGCAPASACRCGRTNRSACSPPGTRCTACRDRFLGDVDDLHLMAAGDPHQVFARAIGADLATPPLAPRSRTVRPAARDSLGEVRHLREIAHALLIDPLPDLVDAHLGLLFRRPRGDQRRAQLILASGPRGSRGPRAVCGEWSGHPA